MKTGRQPCRSTFFFANSFLLVLGGTATEEVRITVEGHVPGGETSLTGRVLDTNAFVEGQDVAVVGVKVPLLDTGRRFAIRR
jgi:hypothetical protein